MDTLRDLKLKMKELIKMEIFMQTRLFQYGISTGEKIAFLDIRMDLCREIREIKNNLKS